MSCQAELAPVATSCDIGGFALCSSVGMVTGEGCADFRVKGTRTMNSPSPMTRLPISASNRSLAPFIMRNHAVIKKKKAANACSNATERDKPMATSFTRTVRETGGGWNGWCTLRKRWKLSETCAGGKEPRSAALRSRTDAAAASVTAVDRPSRARTWSSVSSLAIGALREPMARSGSCGRGEGCGFGGSSGARPAGFGARREEDDGGGCPVVGLPLLVVTGRWANQSEIPTVGFRTTSLPQRGPSRPLREATAWAF